MLYAGVDIGSTTTKCILLDESGEEKAFAHIMTEFNRNVSGEKVLKEALDKAGATEDDIGYIVATGYGKRHSLRQTRIYLRLLPTHLVQKKSCPVCARSSISVVRTAR